MISLYQLGKRISIIGCSNSGKSTLAHALSRKLTIPAYCLDQTAYLENSKWKRNSNELLIERHHKIIAEDSWIIDGNYSVCMAPRFKLAASIIWLDPNVFAAAGHYLLRSIRNDPLRPGSLAKAKSEFSFRLING